MSKAGDIFENPITGESGYVRVGTEETNGELIVSDLRVRPGGAVLGALFHKSLGLSDADKAGLEEHLQFGGAALVVMADFNRGTNQSVTAPFGAACQPILYAFDEAKKENPKGVIGFFDISKRSVVDREILSFTVPFKLYQEMESNVEESFLRMHVWEKLQERQ